MVEVGGGLRTYSLSGHHVLDGYPPDVRCPDGRGQLLMPWPNRIRDGRYTFAGQGHQLALSEPERLNAIHGLARWALWSLLHQAPDSLTLGYRLRPQLGWEWSLDLSVTYALTATGLTVTPRARNVGTSAAPFGFGAHPYLSVGEDRVDEVELGIPASALLRVDDRLLPLELAGVEGTDRDFRLPRRLGKLAIDTAVNSPDARAEGFGQVTGPRLTLMASQVSDAFNTKTRVNADAVWNAGFLPSKAELDVLPKK